MFGSWIPRRFFVLFFAALLCFTCRAACGEDAPPDNATVAKQHLHAALAARVDEEGRAVEPAARFAAGVQRIYLSYALDIDSGFQLDAALEPVSVGAMLSGVPIRSASGSAGPAPAFLTFEAPRVGFLPGQYRVVLSVEGRQLFALPFTVETPPGGDIDPQHFNLLDDRLGGHLDRLSGMPHGGKDSYRLLDQAASEPWQAVGDNGDDARPLPVEITLSFYHREPALVNSAEFVMPEQRDAAPREVEIWAAADAEGTNFSKIAATTLDREREVQQLALPPTEARFIKVVFLSTQSEGVLPLQLRRLRLFEGQRPGYRPLLERFPAIRNWHLDPRHAAQRGIDWLEPFSLQWQAAQQCFGCHAQAQTLMGLAIARGNGYLVHDDTIRALSTFSTNFQLAGGAFSGDKVEPGLTATFYGAMELAAVQRAAVPGLELRPQLQKAAAFLAQKQDPDGLFTHDNARAPVCDGRVMAAANAVAAFDEAARGAADTGLRAAALRALDAIARAETPTTQEEISRIWALSRFGTAEQKRSARRLADGLKRESRGGGWVFDRREEGAAPNPYSTGQALFALSQAGLSNASAQFMNGVKFLMDLQNPDGSWSAKDLQSNFAATMWAVIGLAGSFGETIRTGSFRVDPKYQDAASGAENLEIVLDCSGSMKLPLGKSTRIAVARKVLREVISSLPPQMNVGLRLYGHRRSSKDAATCTDSELAVPLAPLDERQRTELLRVVDGANPRGETPLVYSALAAAHDVAGRGAGAVLLITDGEESCRGDVPRALAEMGALKTKVTLNLVGFTLSGADAERQMSAFAGGAGGRYLPAQDGEALADALDLALRRPPSFTVYDVAGTAIADGTAGDDALELDPGVYRVVIRAGKQTLTVDSLAIAAGDQRVVGLARENGAFVLQ